MGSFIIRVSSRLISQSNLRSVSRLPIALVSICSLLFHFNIFAIIHVLLKWADNFREKNWSRFPPKIMYSVVRVIWPAT